MTLAISQQQSIAIYLAPKRVKIWDVNRCPFSGEIDVFSRSFRWATSRHLDNVVKEAPISLPVFPSAAFEADLVKVTGNPVRC